MKSLTALVLVMALGARAWAATYYVDNVAGNDGNSGTNQAAPWQTLAKVNGTTFQPGDSILFKAGAVWSGTTQLYPKGSGTAAKSIVIDQYGSGPLPVIDAGSATGGGAVRLANQQYWEISNLEITSDAAADGDRRGVHFSASSSGTFRHLYLRNCYIHHIRGKPGTTDGDISAKRTGGVVVEGTGSATKWDDILIEGNTVFAVTNQGIVAVINGNGGSSLNNYYPGTASWSNVMATHVVIRGNTISGVYKNGMILRNTDESGLVERNVLHDTAAGTTGNTIFTSSCRGTVFQYNEGYRNLASLWGTKDGSLYDADLRSPGVVFQYSYSHDNSHGLFWTVPSAEAPNTNVIVRYNISRNDQGNIFSFSGETGSSASTYIYNNTIYVPATNSPTLFDDRAANHQYYAYNNIFYNLSASTTYGFDNSISTRVFDHNVFYGQHPAGEPSGGNQLTNNPSLVNPGSGGLGLDTLAGYKLQTGSPCIDSGLPITTNLTGNPNPGGQDFWGNQVPYNGVTDRGANEYIPAVTPPAITNQAAILTSSNVTLNVLVNPNGGATIWYCQYGTTTVYDAFGPTNILPAGTSTIAVSNVVSAFLPGMLYHYQFVASNSAGTTSGSDATFTTLAVPPTALTQPATAVNAGSASLNASINPGGAPASWYFEYGTNTAYGSFTPTNSLPSGTSPVPVNLSSTPLEAGTLYHFRAVATNSAGTGIGSDAIFTTVPVTPPQLTGLGFSGDGSFQFSFTNSAGAYFYVAGTTNLSLPLSSWFELGPAAEIPPGQYQFADADATNHPHRFYQVRSR